MSASQDEVPEQVWEQDVADGGAIDGTLPTAAAAVVVQGVTTVREVPALSATFGTLTVANGAVVSLGRNPKRRRLLLSVRPSVTATAYIVIGENQQQAAGGYGLTCLQGAALPPIQFAGQLWIAAAGADLQVGFLAELDQG
jgi:hypothetical protein